MREDIFQEVQKVFEIEIHELKRVQAALDKSVITDIVDLLDRCRGKVILCGMGKPGHIGRKIAATMSSMGICACFLHPAEARHGDLGVLSEQDVLIVISNSGETAEIIEMLPNIKMIGTPVVAMTSYPESTLAKFADHTIVLPVITEATALQLAPTSSTTAELVVGDALAAVLSQMRKFKREDFALYHPAGALGRKLTTTVADLMYQGAENPVILLGSTLKSAIYIMNKTGLGAVSVINPEGMLCGLVTDGDLKRYMDKRVDIYSVIVDEVMTRTPVTVKKDILAMEALRIMEKREKQLSVLPVTDEGGRAAGLIRNHDIIRLGIF